MRFIIYASAMASSAAAFFAVLISTLCSTYCLSNVVGWWPGQLGVVHGASLLEGDGCLYREALDEKAARGRHADLCTVRGMKMQVLMIQ